ncbi:MAG: TadE/TadG family type IV pilus assembly protein, partial [Pseudomonadota bacterium]
MTAFLRRFVRNQDGIFALVFAMVTPAMMTSFAATLEYANLVSTKHHFQRAVDSAVLASASLLNDDNPEEVVARFVQQNLALSDVPISGMSFNVKVEQDQYTRRVEVNGTASVDTMFIGILGSYNMQIGAYSSAVESVTAVEIALVLDISSSMNGSRIDQLRDASIKFVEELLGNNQRRAVTISVIPYGGTVRLPSSFYSLVTAAPTFSPATIDYTVAVPDAPENWNGCLEMYAHEIAQINLPAASFGVLPDFTVYTANNLWCPPDDEAEAIFHSSDPAELREMLAKIDNQSLSDGTGTDIGTGWGVRSLDPVWRG